MKKYLFLILFFVILSYNQSFALVTPATSYKTSEEFIAVEGQTCKVATDGCNTIMIQNGQLGASTLMACINSDGTEKPQEWSCQQYNDDSILVAGDQMVGGDVDKNGCINSAGYSFDILASKCLRPWEENISFLSENDQSFYITFKERIGSKTLTKIENAVKKYETELANFPREKRIGLNVKMIEKVENNIEKFLLQFPADTSLSKKDNHKYMLMTIVKFKLMIIGEKMSPMSFNQDNKATYVCQKGNTSYTVYRGDYVVDDMAFALLDDEIHVFDGQFLLPNYTAKREVTASGEKFVGKNTETNTNITFWFKGEELSVYDSKDVLIHICRAVSR